MLRKVAGKRGGTIVEVEKETLSLREVLGAAINGQAMTPFHEKSRNLLVVKFEGTPSWSHANLIAGFRMDAEDLLNRDLTIAGGGRGSVVIKFDVDGGPFQDAFKDSIRSLMKDEAVKTRYGIADISFKAARVEG